MILLIIIHSIFQLDAAQMQCIKETTIQKKIHSTNDRIVIVIASYFSLFDQGTNL